MTRSVRIPNTQTHCYTRDLYARAQLLNGFPNPDENNKRLEPTRSDHTNSELAQTVLSRYSVVRFFPVKTRTMELWLGEANSRETGAGRAGQAAFEPFRTLGSLGFDVV